MVTLGPVLIAVGGLLFLGGAIANHRHARAFREHANRVQRLAEEERTEEMGQEVERFATSRWMSLYEYMMLLEPLSMILVVIGVGMILE